MPDWLSEPLLDLAGLLGGTWMDIATVAALVATVATGALLARTGVRQGHLVFSGMINATEEALYHRVTSPGDLRPVKRSLRIDNAFALSYGALFALLAMRVGVDLDEDSGWRTIAGLAASAAAVTAVADLVENTTFLSVVKRFDRSLRASGHGRVPAIRANVSMTFGTLKMAGLISYGTLLAIATIAEHALIWKILATVLAAALLGFALGNFRSAHRRWGVT